MWGRVGFARTDVLMEVVSVSKVERISYLGTMIAVISRLFTSYC
jgi:uncharacterized protein (DUF4213/DUF364 family)